MSICPTFIRATSECVIKYCFICVYSPLNLLICKYHIFTLHPIQKITDCAHVRLRTLNSDENSNIYMTEQMIQLHVEDSNNDGIQTQISYDVRGFQIQKNANKEAMEAINDTDYDVSDFLLYLL